MKFLNERIEFLKDNPEGYWFKRKLYGWGWTPATKEGWLLIVGYAVFVIGLVLCFEKQIIAYSSQYLFIVALLMILFLGIIVKKGESPKWQWGKKIDNENEK